ncbi:transglycosylase SLT domain-containing protein [Pedobacter sp. HDW13]|uniref:lytic transglycosylase domain-containing protein n=1 Tax=unclassified Pedobacter TaxID=2628915 RepID=UPI000F5A7AC3|nr:MULTISPECIES: lytic transglycosylase domain-containing protein [unclassified Pedobacter]QIL39171.1 transglycosylase SLT domain-containing protein [Pedobacter sp. HDW13]RQO69351.1 lytic transglycosylase [Pedobacter sp. KBW01]
MIKKLLLASICVCFGLISSVSAQQLLHLDSLRKAQNNIFINTDTVAVPLVTENPLMMSQNFIYKLRLDSITKTVPLPYNEYVQQYIDIYAKRKDMFGKMIGLSSYYFPIFDKALKDYNIPQEIKYLTIVESQMNPHAISRVGATGIWQFMFGTGKAYGLKMDNFVDERKDPIQASYAAAAYFRDAFEELGDWLLAIAAYNCGKGNVTRAIDKAGSRDFWVIRQFLPKETRNYVPAFIAAVYVMNYSNKHQITSQACNMFLKTDTVQTTRFVSLSTLAKALNVEESAIFALNPSYKKKIVNGTDDEPKRIVMPKLKDIDFAGVYEVLNNVDVDVNMRVIEASTDDVRDLRKKKAKSATASAVVYHKVTSGQNLTAVADKYGVEVQDLRVWNGLKSKTIVPGQRLKIYAKNRVVLKAPASFLSYKVKTGDTLSEIAEKFDGATVQSIRRDNKLSKAGLQAGMILKISKG